MIMVRGREVVKPGKPAYNIPKVFRPIILLNMLGKLIEKKESTEPCPTSTSTSQTLERKEFQEYWVDLPTR